MKRIFLFGFISGFPWVLIGSALSLWLKENDLSRSTIGWAGLIFGVYAINFLWAPLVDRLKIPFLSMYKLVLIVLKDRNYKKYAIKKPRNINQIFEISEWTKKVLMKKINKNV